MLIGKAGQQPDGRYSVFYKLGAADVDIGNRLKIKSLMSFFQEAAGEQCTEFGSGWNELKDRHGLCYVIVRAEIRALSLRRRNNKGRYLAGRAAAHCLPALRRDIRRFRKQDNFYRFLMGAA